MEFWEPSRRVCHRSLARSQLGFVSIRLRRAHFEQEGVCACVLGGVWRGALAAASCRVVSLVCARSINNEFHTNNGSVANISSVTGRKSGATVLNEPSSAYSGVSNRSGCSRVGESSCVCVADCITSSAGHKGPPLQA